MSRVSIPELVVALQSGAPLRDALASALQDEELTVLYWLDQRQGAAGGGWVDPLGHAAPEPQPRAGRAVKVVEEDGRRIASITYDAALDDEPELLDAVTAAAGLTLVPRVPQAGAVGQTVVLDSQVIPQGPGESVVVCVTGNGYKTAEVVAGKLDEPVQLSRAFKDFEAWWESQQQLVNS